MDISKLCNVEPKPRPLRTLAELLAECDPDAPLTEENRAWLGDAPAGREALVING
jgi:antitoxin ChpS